MFRNKNKKTPELTPLDVAAIPEDSVQQRVIDTIRSLGLDPRLFMVVGSAALTLYGIEPPAAASEEKPAHERPGDVDIIVPPSVFSELLERGATPSGIPLEIKPQFAGRRTILTTVEKPPEGHLPVDIITRTRGDRGADRDQKAFQKHLDKHARPIPGGDGIHVITAKAMESELADRANSTSLGMIPTDRSAADDLYALRQRRYPRG